MIVKIVLSALTLEDSIINHLEKQRKLRDSWGLRNCMHHGKSHVTLKNPPYC